MRSEKLNSKKASKKQNVMEHLPVYVLAVLIGALAIPVSVIAAAYSHQIQLAAPAPPTVTISFETTTPQAGQSDVGTGTTSSAGDLVQITDCQVNQCGNIPNVTVSSGTTTTQINTQNFISGNYMFQACDVSYYRNYGINACSTSINVNIQTQPLLSTATIKTVPPPTVPPPPPPPTVPPPPPACVPATLTIKPPSPSAMYVYPGGSITYSDCISGTAPLTWEWFSSTTCPSATSCNGGGNYPNQPAGCFSFTWSGIPGPAGSVYNVWINANNACGSDYSLNAVVGVLSPALSLTDVNSYPNPAIYNVCVNTGLGYYNGDNGWDCGNTAADGSGTWYYTTVNSGACGNFHAIAMWNGAAWVSISEIDASLNGWDTDTGSTETIC